MQYIVKGETKARGKVQVVASDPAHAIEAARIMDDQGLGVIVVLDTRTAREEPIADFLLAYDSRKIMAGVSASSSDCHEM